MHHSVLVDTVRAKRSTQIHAALVVFYFAIVAQSIASGYQGV
jgi:hypothetical protein